jgi:hypothetical protein
VTQYLGAHLEVPTQFVNDIPWPEREELLDAGHIQVGWICGLPYVWKADKFALVEDKDYEAIRHMERAAQKVIPWPARSNARAWTAVDYIGSNPIPLGPPRRPEKWIPNK